MQTAELGPDGPIVTRIGFGAMHLSLAGRPSEAESIRTLHAGLDAGITLIDTANVYCVDDNDIGHNERVIAKGLAQWEGARDQIVVATKGGLRRPGGAWTRDGRPESLRASCEASLKALGREQIELYQLHAVDPKVPITHSVGELARLREEGKIRHVGLSNVSVKEIEIARGIVPIASVQNIWSPVRREPERDGVLAYCTEHRLAFLPYSPFGGSSGAPSLGKVGKLGELATHYGVSPHRLVLAWMLAKSPVVFPIPGARRPETLLDCAGADPLRLAQNDVERIQASFD